MDIRIAQGSITDFVRKDGRTAIVNAANVAGLGGGGVDGAIHKVATRALRDLIEREFPILYSDVRIPVAGNITMEGFGMADMIIHTVGPIFPTDGARQASFVGEREALAEPDYDPERLLYEALRNVFITAIRHRVWSLAIPAISCGVFGCPFPTFAKCLHRALRRVNVDVTVVLFQDAEVEAFTDAWNALSTVHMVPLEG